MTRARLAAILVALASACSAPQPKRKTIPEVRKFYAPSPTPNAPQSVGWRAPYFAAYITSMHRKIHRLFALGFLGDVDSRQLPAYADQSLWTRLAVVVRDDGAIDRVAIKRASGVLAFDVAAAYAVLMAAPFEAPPSAIVSRDGRVYLDWQFHRDERACGTFGVTPYVLSNDPPPPSEKALQ